MTTVLAEDKTLPVAVGESRALVERVAASVELRRAARLRAFLLYVCEQTLSHGVTVIHEQEIGNAVFGRPQSYDTSIDNIVRVNATELRKRLERYFAEEGAQEDILLEIQRGSYSPTFRRRIPAQPDNSTQRTPDGADDAEKALSIPDHVAQETVASLAEVAELTPTHIKSAPAIVHSAFSTAKWWRLAAGVLLLVCGYLTWQLCAVTMNAEPWKREPALRSFWGNFLASGTQTNIILADTSLAIAEDMMQRPVSLSDYLDYKYKQFAENPGFTEAQRRDLMLVLERNTGSIADFRVGQQILSLDPADPSQLTLQFAREFAPDAAKRNNLVLIGSQQSNPWVSLFASKLNFQLTYDVAQGRPSIVNRAPHAGESSTYPETGSLDSAGTGYAVIAYLPGVSREGKTLIIEGTDSQATGTAGDYVTKEELLRTLEGKFPAGKIPYFEALMRTSELNGVPLHGEVIALRTYNDH
jgi:hypothetical protein